MNKLGIVTGLHSEARALRRHSVGAEDVEIATAAGTAALAAAERLIAHGANALLSFGVAGGLDSKLRPGTLVVAQSIFTPTRVFHADRQWASRVEARLAAHGTVAAGAMAGVDQPVASRFDKMSLFTLSGAVAVDMESHLIAEAAAMHDLPFLALRAIADTAESDVARAALAAAGPDGSIRIGAFLLALAARPWEVLTLPRLARNYRAAMRALGNAAAEIGPTFAIG